MSWTRRSFLASAATAPLAAQQRNRKNAPAAASASRPNVLLILADDLPAWALGCYGNKEIKTPNIDLLARTGTRFQNNFVVTPICSASRATLLSGRLPRQHGIHDFLTPNPVDEPAQGQKEPPASFAKEQLLSDVLAGAGYQCGYVGKWHLGNDAQPGHGIKYSYTLAGGPRRYQDASLVLNGQPVDDKGYLPELLTRRATEFLDQQSAATPFFLTVGYLNPHTPYDGHPERYYEMYRNATFDSFGWQPGRADALREKEYLKDIVGNNRRHAASVTALDDQIPVLLKKLSQKGLRENTIVVFTSDNGFLLGRHGLWSKGHASNPINMYEEVMQVPMIWNWLGKTAPESVRPELVSFYDFAPTLCDALGVPVPNANLPGNSYLPLAMGRAPEKPWRNVVYGNFRYAEMARDTRYKVVVRHNGQGPNELYDLAVDPRENVNRWDDDEYLLTRQRLVKEIETWRAKAV